MCNEIVYLDKPADQSHDLSKQRPSNMNTSLFLPQIWRHLTLRWCFYKLSFWRHPFTAEHPLLSDATLHFSKSDEETNSSPSCMTWGWARFQQSYSFKSTQTECSTHQFLLEFEHQVDRLHLRVFLYPQLQVFLTQRLQMKSVQLLRHLLPAVPEPAVEVRRPQELPVRKHRSLFCSPRMHLCAPKYSN